MHEKIHVLSPLVAPREFIFIRNCRQLNSSIWMVVDVSYDFIKQLQDAAPTRSWMLPSWDVLSNGNASNEIAHISTGTHPGNCISIIQPYVPEENSLLILQKSCIDSLGAMVIYAPIELPSIVATVNGEDTTRIPVLSSGFVISSDGFADKGRSFIHFR